MPPRISQGKECVQGKPLPGFPCAFNQRAAVGGPDFCSAKISSTKREPPFGWLSFVIAHRFWCPHSRPPQGRGSVRGEPLTGSPTRVQSPARRRSLLRSKSAAPKKKDTHVGVFLFWSGRRGSNSLPRPWQGRALPDELRPQTAPLLRHLGASGRSRTNDTRIFSPLLYQLSYRGIWRPRRGSNPRPPA